MNYRTIADLSNLIRTNLYKIPHDIDVVVGVPRSGMLPATMIALYLNKRLSDINTFFVGGGKTLLCGERGSMLQGQTELINKVLIVDDSVDSGNANQKVRNIIKNSELKCSCIFFAPYVTRSSKGLIDIYLEEVECPRIFEWNLMHHSLLQDSCVDIDGVLNVDPPIDDDGPIYTKYIKEAPPLFVPTAKIGCLVSCRLEKYRSLTEEWLSNHNIKYDNLILLDFPNKEKRIQWNRHGEYKAEWYKKKKAKMFIESSVYQAQVIANITKRPVICIETNSIVSPNTLSGKLNLSMKQKLVKRFPNLVKFLIKIKKIVRCQTYQ